MPIYVTSSENSYDALDNALYIQDKNQRIQTIRSLIEAGKDANSCNIHGESVLMSAARRGYDDCVQVLLEAGAVVNHSDDDRKTALMLATWFGHVECVQLLLEAGVDVNHSNGDGQTALVVAAWRGHDVCVRLLLEAGAHVDDVDTSGHTTLISCLAAYAEFKNLNALTTQACLKLLVNAGADINARDNTGLQPIHFAFRLWPDFTFPAEYLISENCNLSKASHDHIQSGLTEEGRLDILKLLFACGLPRYLCQSFIVEQETSVRNWVESVAAKPHTLKSTCVFEIRRNLGHRIKSKVRQLSLPNVIQSLILLKGVLSLECFI